MKGRPLRNPGLTTALVAQTQTDRADFAGYVPTRFLVRGNELRVRWLQCSPAEFRDPFFGQTEERLIGRALGDTVVETGVDKLPSGGGYTYAEPAGFVFHTSFCGSTLLSNMLAAIPDHLVLSEPEAVASLLSGIDDQLGRDLTSYIPLLRSTLNALGRWSAAITGRYFLKFFSQDVLEVEMLRRAVTGVPEIFVYRHPLEVLVANLRAPTQSWIWSEKHTGMPICEAVELPAVELLARGIGRTMQAMLDHAGSATLLVNYNEIGPATPRLLLDFFCIPATERVLGEMTQAMVYDAKDLLRQKLFRRDVEDKRAKATSRIRELVAEFADAPFRRLEARRQGQHHPSIVNRHLQALRNMATTCVPTYSAR